MSPSEPKSTKKVADFSIASEHVPSKTTLISKADHFQSWFTFTFLGFVALYGWNCILNCIYDIMGYIYHDAALADSLILIYETFNILMYFFLLIKGGVRPKLLISACGVCGTLFILVPTIIQIWGDGSTTGVTLLHVIVVPISLCIGSLIGAGLGISSAMPYNYAGFIGFGQGISGIGSFGLYLMSDRLLFTREHVHSAETRAQLTKTSWLLFGSGGAICYIGGVLLYFLSRKEWFKERVDAYWSQFYKEKLHSSKHDKKDESDVPIMYKSARNIKLIVKDCWQQLFNSFFGLGITLFLFPLIGPYGWVGTNMNDINVGVFQIFDFVGRYLPVLSIFRIKKNFLIYITLLRFIFIPVFTISAFYTSLTFFNTFWFQAIVMFLFATSNGWIITQTMIFIPSYVERIKEKGRVGTYNGFIIQCSVIVGLYGSKLYKTILDVAFGNSSQAPPA